MPKNFDELLIEDRTFIVSGEEFEWVNKHWSQISEWIDESVTAPTTNGNVNPGDTEETPERPTLLGTMEKEAEEVARYLAPSDHERWFALVNDKEREDPVTFVQLTAIGQWLMEQSTSRPTAPAQSGTPSGGSSSGRGKRERSSAAA